MKLGILSDTHGYMDDRILEHLKNCDEIWHAGDIGNVEVMGRLQNIAPSKAVFGNIDGQSVRSRYPENIFEEIEGVKLMMRHIAGSLGRYNAATQSLLKTHRPKVLICGHSHILKIMFDKRFNTLYLNPGAAGRHGFHKVRTLVRVDIEHGKLTNCEVVELGPRSAKTID